MPRTFPHSHYELNKAAVSGKFPFSFLFFFFHKKKKKESGYQRGNDVSEHPLW